MERLWAWADENNIDEMELPRDKSGLINIRELNLLSKHFTELPKEIGQLTNLRALSLFNNNLTALPKEIVNLTNLKYVQFDQGLMLSLEQTNWAEKFKIQVMT